MIHAFSSHNQIVLAYFWPATLVELAVIALVARRVLRSRRGGLSSRGRAMRGTAGLWSLPLYVWAWQANRLLLELVANAPTVVATPRLYERAVEAIFISLCYLIALQTFGTLVTRDAPITLGVTGHVRTATTAALLATFLDVAFFILLVDDLGIPRGIPFHLR